MSTLQTTPQHHDGTRTRLGTGALALSTLIAIGLALLILVPTNQRTTAPAARSTAQQAALTAETPGPASCFRDPATHALTCYHSTPAPVATAAPAGYFRDPATHKLTTIAHKPAAQLLPNRARGRIIP